MTTKLTDEDKENLKLDFNLKTKEERLVCVQRLVDNLNSKGIDWQKHKTYLEFMSNYLLLLDVPKAHKDKEILTPNRMKTINKREQSYEAAVDALPGGDDELALLINPDPASIPLCTKEVITDKDIETIPGIKDAMQGIEELQIAYNKAEGKDKFIIKNAIIENQKQIYTLKSDYINYVRPLRKGLDSAYLQTYGDISFDAAGNIHQEGGYIQLWNEDHVRILLNNYSKIKEENEYIIDGNMKWMIMDFENIIDKCIKPNPLLFDVLVLKIDGETNSTIGKVLKEKYDVDFNDNKISKIWCHIIPNIIAEYNYEQELIWWYKNKGLPMKKCNKCGEEKPANEKFWHRNKKSKDGWYCVCKKCRSTKKDLISQLNEMGDE